MNRFLSKVKDGRLLKLVDSIPTGDSRRFSQICAEYEDYDRNFLWLLCYGADSSSYNREYIEKAYEKFSPVLDQDFPRTSVKKGNFDSRLWELILCDILSESGKLKPKKATGADFILDSTDGLIQVEAVAPDESSFEGLRAEKPDYSENNMWEGGGPIHEIESPVVLRVITAFKRKASRYDRNLPIIIAINSSKTVGTISDENYVLRRIFFGLGNIQLIPHGNGYKRRFEQLPEYSKPGGSIFPVAFFRDPDYCHISGVIYTSQNPLSLTPGGVGWLNSGITFLPNPMAKNPVNINFPFFKTLKIDSRQYRELGAPREFESSVYD